MTWSSGDEITTERLNRPAPRVIADGSRLGQTRGTTGTALRRQTRPPISVRLAGSGPAYQFAQVLGIDGSWGDVPKAGTAYEVNQLAGLAGNVVRAYPDRFGAYRFQWIASGKPSCSVGILLPYPCAGTTNAANIDGTVTDAGGTVVGHINRNTVVLGTLVDGQTYTITANFTVRLPDGSSPGPNTVYPLSYQGDWLQAARYQTPKTVTFTLDCKQSPVGIPIPTTPTQWLGGCLFTFVKPDGTPQIVYQYQFDDLTLGTTGTPHNASSAQGGASFLATPDAPDHDFRATVRYFGPGNVQKTSMTTITITSAYCDSQTATKTALLVIEDN